MKVKTRKSVESLLIETVELGLQVLENPLKETKLFKSDNALIQSAEISTYEAYRDSKRIAPYGIKENMDYGD